MSYEREREREDDSVKEKNGERCVESDRSMNGDIQRAGERWGRQVAGPPPMKTV